VPLIITSHKTKVRRNITDLNEFRSARAPFFKTSKQFQNEVTLTILATATMTEPNLHQRLLEYLDEDDDDLVEMLTFGHVFTTGTIAATYTFFSNIVRSTGDRSGPRKKRKRYNHERALQIIHEDYLGRDSLHGEDFKSMFRVSLSTFQYILIIYFKNCPVAWQGSFKGKEKRSSIILEAVSDHHLFIWHFAYGFAGSYNDLHVLRESPLFEKYLNGQIQSLEKEADEFDALYLLCDVQAPPYSVINYWTDHTTYMQT
jgi:hypothetical protein